MQSFSPAWDHGEIRQIFPDCFFVMGTNVVLHDGRELQFSRNMFILREEERLTLINTVRLYEHGLQALEALGTVDNVVRLGAFHGRDDAFYIDRYDAALWAFPDMLHEHGEIPSSYLATWGESPFSQCKPFLFETSTTPEGYLLIEREGGILVTCDSIQNWVEPDLYFNEETALLYSEHDLFKQANISPIWLAATGVQKEDFERMLALDFKHLISAHGEPLFENAHQAISKRVEQCFTK